MESMAVSTEVRIRLLFYLILVPIFLVQLWFAVHKWESGQPGTIISQVPNPKILLPAIQMCDAGGLVPVTENSTPVSLYEESKQLELVVIFLDMNEEGQENAYVSESAPVHAVVDYMKFDSG